jgi:hypothetical protein
VVVGALMSPTATSTTLASSPRTPTAYSPTTTGPGLVARSSISIQASGRATG